MKPVFTPVNPFLNVLYIGGDYRNDNDGMEAILRIMDIQLEVVK